MPARVFSVVDAFDAMTTDRPYRAALSLEHAAGEITGWPAPSSTPTW